MNGNEWRTRRDRSIEAAIALSVLERLANLAKSIAVLPACSGRECLLVVSAVLRPRAGVPAVG